MASVVFYIRPADVDVAMARLVEQLELRRSSGMPPFWHDKYGNSIVTMRDSLAHDELRWAGAAAPSGVARWIAYHTDVRWERAAGDPALGTRLLAIAAELCDAANVSSFVAIYDAVGIEELLVPDEQLLALAALIDTRPTTLASRTFPAHGADPTRVFAG